MLLDSLYALAHSIDTRTRLSEDLYLIPTVLFRVAQHVASIMRGKVSYWYSFEKTVKAHPDKVALKYPRLGDDGFEIESYTYKELYDMILRFSQILYNDYGVRPNDKVALSCTNKPLFLILWFALWNIGARPAFLNYNISEAPLVHCLKIVNASFLFVDEECARPVRESADLISSSVDDCKVHFLKEESLMETLKSPDSYSFRLPDSYRNPEDKDYDVAALIYTSGTTGLPKSAIMSWRKCFLASSIFAHAMRINDKSVVFTAMPLYHSTAAILGVLPAFTCGGTVVISHKFSASTFWTQVKLSHANTIQYVGEVCRYLLQTPYNPDENSLEVKVAYGNGLRPDIWQKFKERFGIEYIGEFYAATESPFATTNFQKGDFGVGACQSYGKLVNFILQYHHCLVKMDPEDNSVIYRNPKTGRCEVPEPGESGEMLMRILFPRNVKTSFQGYLNNKDETESKVIRNVFRKGDAWYRSGDLMKSDKEGCLYFLDRLGDTFRWKSENVSTAEVENEILKLQQVVQCVVVGVKVPGYEGRAGCAYIETKSDAEKVLQELTSLALPSYAKPVFVNFCDIVLTDNHKIAKKAFMNPDFPNGGGKSFYILNGKEGKYELLTDELWEKVVSGELRL